jgi:hypothetical protein
MAVTVPVRCPASLVFVEYYYTSIGMMLVVVGFAGGKIAKTLLWGFMTMTYLPVM